MVARLATGILVSRGRPIHARHSQRKKRTAANPKSTAIAVTTH
jgi:hypothetical protein